MIKDYIYRFFISEGSASTDSEPDVGDIVVIILSASSRSEADNKLDRFLSEDLKLFMVEHYDHETKTYVEEDL